MPPRNRPSPSASAEPTTAEKVEYTLNPAAVAIAKVLLGLGVAGLVLYLSPWTPEVLFKGLIAPLLVVALFVAGLGLAGRGVIEQWNLSTGEYTKAQVVAALRAMSA